MYFYCRTLDIYEDVCIFIVGPRAEGRGRMYCRTRYIYIRLYFFFYCGTLDIGLYFFFIVGHEIYALIFLFLLYIMGHKRYSIAHKKGRSYQYIQLNNFLHECIVV